MRVLHLGARTLVVNSTSTTITSEILSHIAGQGGTQQLQSGNIRETVDTCYKKKCFALVTSETVVFVRAVTTTTTTTKKYAQTKTTLNKPHLVVLDLREVVYIAVRALLEPFKKLPLDRPLQLCCHQSLLLSHLLALLHLNGTKQALDRVRNECDREDISKKFLPVAFEPRGKRWPSYVAFSLSGGATGKSIYGFPGLPWG